MKKKKQKRLFSARANQQDVTQVWTILQSRSGRKKKTCWNVQQKRLNKTPQEVLDNIKQTPDNFRQSNTAMKSNSLSVIQDGSVSVQQRDKNIISWLISRLELITYKR